MLALLVLLSVLSLRGADLDRRIDALIESGAIAKHASPGIHVVDLATGKTLYRHNEERLFLPASNMKLFSSALSLLRLGPAHRFMTHLVRAPSCKLWIAGSG